MAPPILRLCEDRFAGAGCVSGHRLQRAVDALVGSPERCFTLVELACLCNSSVFHFAHSFKAHVGMAPFAFQRHLRIQKARALLSRTDLTIEEIGNAVGCENASSFSRLFRNVTSQSPREFRRRHRAELKDLVSGNIVINRSNSSTALSLQPLLGTEDQRNSADLRISQGIPYCGVARNLKTVTFRAMWRAFFSAN